MLPSGGMPLFNHLGKNNSLRGIYNRLPGSEMMRVKLRSASLLNVRMRCSASASLIPSLIQGPK